MSNKERSPNRREFLAATIGAASAAVLVGCDSDPVDTDAGGGGDAGGGDAGPLVCNQIMFVMGNAHPPGFRHSIDVPLADVTAGVEKTYDITGESPHAHTVVVTAAHFASIASGARVDVESSTDMGIDLHSHVVTLFCSA